MMTPGFYQMTFRGLSWRELWRFSSGPLTFVVAIVLKAIGFRGSKLWLPAIDGETFCEKSALGENVLAAIMPMVAEATRLGYLPGRYLTIRRDRNPSACEGGAYLCLHRDGNRVLHLAHVVTEVMNQPRPVTNITGGIVDAVQDLTYDFSPTREQLDGDGFAMKIRVEEPTVTATDAAMLAFLERNAATPRQFRTLDEFKAIADRIDTAMWNARVERGLFRYVG